jgi:hypothetical protein
MEGIDVVIIGVILVFIPVKSGSSEIIAESNNNI